MSTTVASDEPLSRSCRRTASGSSDTPRFLIVSRPTPLERSQPRTALTFHGTADCNQIAGTYKTPGANGLTIELGVSTMAFCPEGSMADLYVHALSRSKTWAIANDTLTITLTGPNEAGTFQGPDYLRDRKSVV